MLRKRLFSPASIILYLLLLNIFFGSLFTYSIYKKQVIKLPIGDTIQVVSGIYRGIPKRTVYGYLPYWMLGNAQYIKYDTLTDISYFGLYVGTDGNFLKQSNGETDRGYKEWKESDELKEAIKQSKLKNIRFSLTLLGPSDTEIDRFLVCRSCWNTLLTNVKTELKEKGITDINLDFEHSTLTSNIIQTRYTEFAEFINTELDKEFGDSKVVVAAFGDSFRRTRVTNPTALASKVDGIFMMAYDFHQPTSEFSGPVAPLGGAPEKYDYDITSAVNDFKNNVSSYKLILGVPYYGYNFVVDTAKPGARRIPGNDSIGYSISWPYAEAKASDYVSIDRYSWDEEAKSPYIMYVSPETGSNRIFYFENERSLKEKYDFVINNNLMGVGIWALGYDGKNDELWNLLRTSFKY